MALPWQRRWRQVYDKDALAYFARVERVSSFNNAYGVEYTKKAISDFFVQGKDERWLSKVVEFYMFRGVSNLAGCLQKMIYHASAGPELANFNFVSGDYKSATEGIVVAQSDFSSGNDIATGFNEVLSHNQTVDGSAGWLRFYANASNGIHGCYVSTGSMVVGKRYRLRVKVYLPTGQASTSTLLLSVHGQPIVNTFLAKDEVQVFEATFVSTATTPNVYFMLRASFNPFVGANNPTEDVAFIKDFIFEDVTDSPGGLKGNGLTKYLTTGFNQNVLDKNNRGRFAYQNVRDETANACLGGSDVTLDNNLWALINNSSGEQSYWASDTSGGPFSGNKVPGFWHGISHENTAAKLFLNGVMQQNVAISEPTTQNVTDYVFGLNRAGTLTVPTTSRLAVAGITQAMSDTEVLAFYNATQKLMAKLGGAV